jgi:hypothetical protein
LASIQTPKVETYLNPEKYSMEPKAMRIILKTLLGLGLILPIWPSSASEGQRVALAGDG